MEKPMQKGDKETFIKCMMAIDQRGREEGLTWDELCGYTADEVLHYVIRAHSTAVYEAIIDAGLAIMKENAERLA